MASDLTEDELARLEALAGARGPTAFGRLGRGARDALPRLTAEVRRLRAELEEERARWADSAVSAALQHDQLRRERDRTLAKLGRALSVRRFVIVDVASEHREDGTLPVHIRPTPNGPYVCADDVLAALGDDDGE